MEISGETAGPGGQTPLLRLSGNTYARAHAESWDASLEVGYFEATDYPETVIARLWYALVTDPRRRLQPGELVLERVSPVAARLGSRARRSAPYRARGDARDAFLQSAGTGVISWLTALPSSISRIEVSGEHALMASHEWRFSETTLDRLVLLAPETHPMLDDVIAVRRALE
jgi:hypothetical protein